MCILGRCVLFDLLQDVCVFCFFSKLYLVPQALAHTGVLKEKVNVTDEAMKRLIKSYCRESGVRNLQKHIEKVRLFACLPTCPSVLSCLPLCQPGCAVMTV